ADPEPIPSVTAIIIWSGEPPSAKLPSAYASKNGQHLARINYCAHDDK
ncbi:7599_t:CDS:1, partial [Funneliformis caledonium]